MRLLVSGRQKFVFPASDFFLFLLTPEAPHEISCVCASRRFADLAYQIPSPPKTMPMMPPMRAEGRAAIPLQ